MCTQGTTLKQKKLNDLSQSKILNCCKSIFNCYLLNYSCMPKKNLATRKVNVPVVKQPVRKKPVPPTLEAVVCWYKGVQHSVNSRVQMDDGFIHYCQSDGTWNP
jgi:hypothetical protein